MAMLNNQRVLSYNQGEFTISWHIPNNFPVMYPLITGTPFLGGEFSDIFLGIEWRSSDYTDYDGDN